MELLQVLIAAQTETFIRLTVCCDLRTLSNTKINLDAEKKMRKGIIILNWKIFTLRIWGNTEKCHFA